MLHTIENNRLRVTVHNHGAEVVSIYDKMYNRECVWNADPSWWKRSTPVLFPIVGNLWDQTMRVAGKEYYLSQHGFARDMDFECVEETESMLRYSLKANDETMAKYPFRFELQMTHILEENSVITRWTVINHDQCVLPFQIGGHPAYMVPDCSNDLEVTGRLTIDGPKEHAITRIGEKGCVKAGCETFVGNEVILKCDTFKTDAIIYEEPCPQRVEMFGHDGRHVLTFEAACLALGIWAPTKEMNAPFVCIEPWWGRTDRVGYTGEFADREYIQNVPQGESLSGEWKVSFAS